MPTPSLQKYLDRWHSDTISGQEEIAPLLWIVNDANETVDWSGLTSLKMRLQLGSADELTINIMARDTDGRWRPDMGVWQKGGVLVIAFGFDGDYEPMQKFTLVSTTVQYPESGPETLVVRGVSELARALHNKDARSYSEASDEAVVDDICAFYGWDNGVTAELASSRARIKKKGRTDLDLLRLIATEALLGAPRVDAFGTLTMPEPMIGEHTYARGVPITSGARRLLNFSPSREGGADAIQIQITGWDPDQEKWVSITYQADEFSEDPEIVFEGPAAVQAPIPTDSSTRGLTLKVIEVRGQGAGEKKDVIATGTYVREKDAESLAKRWFALREKLSRWSNISVPGHNSLVPYIAVTVEGELADMDKGLWLPTVVEHTLDDKGWKARLTAIRVVQETTVTAIEDAG